MLLLGNFKANSAGIANSRKAQSLLAWSLDCCRPLGREVALEMRIPVFLGLCLGLPATLLSKSVIVGCDESHFKTPKSNLRMG